MKKILLFCFCIAFTMAGFSQNNKENKEFVLTQVHSSDDMEYSQYTYNDDMLLQAKKALTVDGIQFIDSLSYDEFNNISRLSTYQLLQGEWIYVYFIDYTYDENGNCLTRSNYNSFGTPNFTLGGVYTYFYDEDNKLTNWELHLSGTMLLEVCSLAYNEDGKVIQEIRQTVSSGNYENSLKFDYQYNPDGTIESRSHSFWRQSSWDLDAWDLFFYDEHANCIMFEHMIGNTVTDRNEYEYDMEYTADQIIVPVEPDAYMDVANLVAMNNKVTLKHWYTMNDNTGELVYVCDYIYTYDTLNYTTIPNYVFTPDDVRIFPNPAADVVTIAADYSVVRNIDVMDNAGKVVLTESDINNRATKLDITGLKPGVYYLRLFTSKGVVTEKLFVQ